MLTGAVVADLVGADELGPDGDLDGVADDGDLDLSAAVLGADAIAGGCEADAPRRVDLAGDRGSRGGGSGARGFAAPGHPLALLFDRVASGVGGDELAAVQDLDEAVVTDQVDLLAGEPPRGLVAGGGEADGAVAVDPPGRNGFGSERLSWAWTGDLG